MLPGANEKYEPESRFAGFQNDEKDCFPLFNVLKKGHKLEGSTVTLETLMREGLKYPKYYLEYHSCKGEYTAMGCANPNCNAEFEMCVCGEQVALISGGCKQCKAEADLSND